MNKSVVDMAILRCNNDIFEQMNIQASNGSKIIISICFFSEFKYYPFLVMLIISRVSDVMPKVSFHFKRVSL